MNYSIFKYLLVYILITCGFSSINSQTLDDWKSWLTYAHLSSYSYNQFDYFEKVDIEGSGTWHVMNQMEYEDSGLSWTLFEKRTSTTLPNGKIEYKTIERVLAYRGTQKITQPAGWVDWITNIIQGARGPNKAKQYTQALDVAFNQSNEANRDNFRLTITGHSLGGGIAQYASLATNTKAVVFNSAPIGFGEFAESTKHPFVSKMAKSNIVNISNRGDLVYRIPGSQYGQQIHLNAINEKWEIETPSNKYPTYEEVFTKPIIRDIKAADAVLFFHDMKTIIRSTRNQIRIDYKKQELSIITNSSNLNSSRSIPLYSIPQTSSYAASNLRTALDLTSKIKNPLVVGTLTQSSQYINTIGNRIGTKNFHYIERLSNVRDLKRYANDIGADAIFMLPKIELPQNKPPTRRRQDVYPDIQRTIPFTSPHHPPPTPSAINNNYSNRVGGVMLSNVADLSGDNINSDNFSLIFENEEGIIDIEELRRFVTALWAVYFGEEVPGISIDPIAPDIDKHLVRYIGQVINLDIGRVMREADYKMKEWAVGTGKPDIEGFKNVDELSMIKGIRYLGASRRFWFVPEEMQFQLMGDILVFESGRMTLKTEYIGKSNQAEPADIAFAKFFTENYDTISSKYPLYADLFDYAKLVSFARYLEEKNIPLLWFLLANKDLVLTEDSPGTVDAFAKKSDYLEYVWIEGGVELGNESTIGNYVIDEAAAKAIQTSLATYKINKSKNDKSFYAKPVVLKSGEKNLTYAPSKSLVIGSEQAKNEKYHTDIFIRDGKSKNLELVRYYNPNYQGLPTIGNNWHLMIPYQVEPFGEGNIIWEGNLFSPKYLVNNLLTGKTDTLSFNDQRYSVAGYVPEDSLASNLIGLFFLTDGSLRLADKIGVEYQFDNGLMSQMIISENYFFQYDYDFEIIESESLDYQPYRIKSKEGQVMIINQEKVPSILRLINKSSGKEELFIFDKNNEFGVWGYSPIAKDSSHYKILAVMQDESYLLVDKFNNEIRFDSDGNFLQLKSWVIKSLSKGDLRVDFDYGLFGGQQYIVKATLKDKNHGSEIHWIEYEHDKKGNLTFIHTKDGKKIKIENEVDKSFFGKNTILLIGAIGIIGAMGFLFRRLFRVAKADKEEFM